MRNTYRCTTAAAALLIGAATANAELVSLEVTTQPAYDGQAFGDAGAYQLMQGRAHFALDPTSDRASRIVDIEKAPVNAEGMVEFSSDVTIMAPASAEAGSRVMFYEVPNRGRNLSFGLLNAARSLGTGLSMEDPGDGFLMRQGHTIVWGGWQSGMEDGFSGAQLPTLKDVIGQSREEFVFDDTEAVSTVTLSYPAAEMDPAKATLTVRQNADDDRTTPEGLSFEYVDERTVRINRPAGDGGAIYEFTYPAKDAIPAGLGFIATADLVSFLRGNGTQDIPNPIGPIEHTIGMGISQSGRFLRDFIYQGFNADAEGKPVFDGAMPHIAGSRKSFTNYRFAQQGRYSRQHEDHDFPGDQFPFTYPETVDPVSGRTDGIFTACRTTETCPKLMHTDSSTEFWQGRAALVSTLADGTPIQMPQDVRLYFIAGAPHYTTWDAKSEETATCVFDSNPVSMAPTMRALTVAMADWVRDGVEPPASVYPAGTDALIDPAALTLPTVDGDVATPPANQLRLRDHDKTPAEVGDSYASLVPRVDDDGMPLGGVRQVQMAAPLGTYWGWNLRREGFAGGNLCGLTGSYIAFPQSASNSDSRAPVTDRYDGADAYAASVNSAAEDLVTQGFLLTADKDLAIGAAPDWPLQ
ncbi:alpha/beta hydrolase domain-containing protein [Paracoccus sp. R86501]|uniref:alpha/beta hydrolase domain-containing protein n=1 Tax=Paracoccus sp. R86501 TaxID=3101711 RepID=UPI00366E880A